MSDYWFKPKTHGYGAYPTGWQGWTAIVAFVAAVQAAMWPLVVGPALRNEAPTIAGVLSSLAVVALMTWWFLRIVRRRTDGDWRWRWGGRET